MRYGMPGNALEPSKPPELTAEQRAELVAAIQQDPYVGHVKAARAAGIAGSAGQIRQLLADDEEFQEALAEARRSLITKAGLTFEHLLTKLASIVDDDGHSSQLRAVERGFAILGHPIKDAAQDVSGSD
jgi:predicted lysophospholipase L1 biosynthesis ABC-type transport system permease subunit